MPGGAGWWEGKAWWGEAMPRSHFGHTALEAGPRYVAAEVHQGVGSGAGAGLVGVWGWWGFG